MLQSKINPQLTPEYLTNEPENMYFDRKSGKIRPSDIADLICGFANAEGGVIVIGISDKDNSIDGLNKYGNDKVNDFILAPKTYCNPAPSYRYEVLEAVNEQGQADRVLLLHISPSVEQIIRTTNNATYLRMADKTREIRGEDLRNLEYSKSTRHYEDECNMNATIADLDVELLQKYSAIINVGDVSNEQILRARGFLINNNGQEKLTNAAVLLFAKNIYQFYPNCRIRILRYDGNAAQVGTSINIVKDINLDRPILRIIQEAKSVIYPQLRDFTTLNRETGKFEDIPEYPEFAWVEGIVNAVVHREYGLYGAYIKVSIFDDRLEILSPGSLPSIVTVDNIKYTRFARNPKIARVLTEFGIVKELNEGVPRIYADMKKLFLDEPVYTEMEHQVKLTLKNNIVMRNLRQSNRVEDLIGDKWQELDELEKKILIYMWNHKETTRGELEEYTERSAGTITGRLNSLIEFKIVKRVGKPRDPKQIYTLL